jgi:hypothetical protein
MGQSSWGLWLGCTFAAPMAGIYVVQMTSRFVASSNTILLAFLAGIPTAAVSAFSSYQVVKHLSQDKEWSKGKKIGGVLLLMLGQAGIWGVIFGLILVICGAGHH